MNNFGNDTSISHYLATANNSVYYNDPLNLFDLGVQNAVD